MVILRRDIFDAMPSLLLSFIFFFIIEWRWEAILFNIISSTYQPYIILALVAVFVICFMMLRHRNGIASWWVIILVLVYLTSTSVLSFPELSRAHDYRFKVEVGLWCINIALFLAASDKKLWNYVYTHNSVAVALFALYVLPPLFILFFSGHAAEAHYNIRNLQNIVWNWNFEDLGVSYQSFGDKISILTFILVSLRINKFVKLTIVAITLVSLYIVGSKASMVGYVFACAAYYVISLYCSRRYLKCAFLLSCSFCLLLCGLTYIVNNPAMQYSDNWLIRTIASGQKDISVSARQEIEIENQKTRSSRLMLGDYKFDYKLGRPGSYTHSAIGIIDYYGLPIFLISVGIWLYLLFKLMRLVKHRIPLVTAALMAMLFYTLLFTIARFPPLNYLLYWTLGMAVCAITYASATRNNVTHRHIQRQLT